MQFHKRIASFVPDFTSLFMPCGYIRITKLGFLNSVMNWALYNDFVASAMSEAQKGLLEMVYQHARSLAQPQTYETGDFF
jgi:hypothetical protein